MILPPPGQRSASYEVRFKQSHDWPLAMASVNLTMDGDTVRTARVVLGAVAPVPWRAPAAERVLAGKVDHRGGRGRCRGRRASPAPSR